MLSINQPIITLVVAEGLMNGSTEKDRKCPDLPILWQSPYMALWQLFAWLLPNLHTLRRKWTSSG